MSEPIEQQTRLVEALRDGEPEAYQTLVNRLVEPLSWRAERLVDDPAAAQDLVQQVLVDLWACRETLPSSDARLRGYCFRMLMNRTLHHLRSERRRRHHEHHAAVAWLAAQADRGAYDGPAERAVAQDVWELALSLPGPLREVLVQRFGLGLTLDETARALELPVGTVSTRQRAALLRLREHAGTTHALDSAHTPGASDVPGASSAPAAGVRHPATSSAAMGGFAPIAIPALIGHLVRGAEPSTGFVDLLTASGPIGSAGAIPTATSASSPTHLSTAHAGPIQTSTVLPSSAGGTASPGLHLMETLLMASTSAKTVGLSAVVLMILLALLAGVLFWSPIDDRGRAGSSDHEPTVGLDTAEPDAHQAGDRQPGAPLRTEPAPASADAPLDDGAASRSSAQHPDDPIAPIAEGDPLPNEGEAEEAPAGARIVGRVVDLAGDPIVGASVTLTRAVERQPMFPQDRVAPSPATATTDEDGRFAIATDAAAVASGSGYLEARAEGYMSAVEIVSFSAPRTDGRVSVGDITLAQPGRIVGIVVGPDGAPVADAVVHLGRALGNGVRHMNRGDSQAIMMLSPPPGQDDQGRPELHPDSLYTEQDGSFELREVWPRVQVVSATKEGFSSAEESGVQVQPGETTRVRLELGEPLGITITVQDDQGQPVEGARVRAGTGIALLLDGRLGNEGAPLLTDATGTVTFSGIESREARISIKAEGYVDWQSRVRLYQTDTLAVTLVAGFTVTGRVVGPDGALLENIQLWLESLRENDSSGTNRATTRRVFSKAAQPASGFARQGVEPGPFEIKVLTPAGTHTFGPYIGVAGETLDVGSLEVATAAGTIRVTVLDATGAPVEGATVEYGDAGTLRRQLFAAASGQAIVEIGRAPQLTDADGVALIEDIADGEAIAVLARHPQLGRGFAEQRTLAGGQTLEVAITLQQGVTLTGLATDASGGPAADQALSLDLEGRAGSIDRAVTGSNGTYRFENLPPGRYAISVSGYGRISGWVEVRAGETEATLDVEIPATQVLEGVVLRADGTLATGLAVAIGQARPGAGGQYHLPFVRERVVTDTNGRFRFEGPNLRGSLMVTAPDESQHLWRLSPAMTEGGALIELRLPPSGVTASAIVGRVTDVDSGQPLSGVRVIATRQSVDAQPLWRAEALASGDGQFRFDDVPAGAYQLEFIAHGRALEVRRLDVPAEEATTVRMDAELHAPGVLMFELIDRGTQGPLSIEGQERVITEAFLDGDPSATRSRTTPASELVVFANLRAGQTYRVRFTVPGYLPYEAVYSIIDAAATPIQVALTRG